MCIWFVFMYHCKTQQIWKKTKKTKNIWLFSLTFFCVIFYVCQLFTRYITVISVIAVLVYDSIVDDVAMAAALTRSASASDSAIMEQMPGDVTDYSPVKSGDRVSVQLIYVFILPDNECFWCIIEPRSSYRVMEMVKVVILTWVQLG